MIAMIAEEDDQRIIAILPAFNRTKAALEILAQAQLLPSVVDIQLETLRLAALIEGLSILAMLRPELYTPETVEQIVIRHLQELCSRETDV